MKAGLKYGPSSLHVANHVKALRLEYGCRAVRGQRDGDALEEARKGLLLSVR